MGESVNMTSHIKLYGSKGERFENIKAEMSERLGYDPSNPEVIGLLMSNYDSAVIGGQSARTVADFKR